MGQPNVKGVLVSGPLQNVSLAYRNRRYIAERIFPTIDCPPGEAKIGRYLKADWFRDEAAIRAPGTKAARGGYKVDTVSISTKEYAFAKEVTEEDRAMSALPNTPPLKPESDAIEFVTDKLLLKKEVLCASTIFAATWSSVSGGYDTDGAWAAGASNTFISDIETKIDYIESQTGFRPNVLMLSSNTLKELKMEATVLERIKYTQRGIISAELIAALFDLEEVIVGGQIKNTASETAAGAEFTASRIWEKNASKGSAFLYYRPASPGLKVPSTGYMPRKPYRNGQYRQIRTWNEPAEDQDVYECKEEFQVLQTGTDLGYLWKDTILT